MCLNNKLEIHMVEMKSHFVPQSDRTQPQLLFTAVLARIVVQTLKETTDKLDEKMSEEGGGALRASQFEDHDMEQLLALHHTALRIKYLPHNMLGSE